MNSLGIPARGILGSASSSAGGVSSPAAGPAPSATAALGDIFAALLGEIFSALPIQFDTSSLLNRSSASEAQSPASSQKQSRNMQDEGGQDNERAVGNDSIRFQSSTDRANVNEKTSSLARTSSSGSGMMAVPAAKDRSNSDERLSGRFADSSSGGGDSASLSPNTFSGASQSSPAVTQHTGPGLPQQTLTQTGAQIVQEDSAQGASPVSGPATSGLPSAASAQAVGSGQGGDAARGVTSVQKIDELSRAVAARIMQTGADEQISGRQATPPLLQPEMIAAAPADQSQSLRLPLTPSAAENLKQDAALGIKAGLLDLNASSLGRISNNGLSSSTAQFNLSGNSSGNSLGISSGNGQGDDKLSTAERTKKALQSMSSEQQEQLVQKIKDILDGLSQNRNGKSLTVRLDPPGIGGMLMKVAHKGGQVFARLIPDSPEVETLLRGRVSDLVHALQTAGLSPSNVHISVGAERSAGELFNVAGFLADANRDGMNWYNGTGSEPERKSSSPELSLASTAQIEGWIA